MGGVYGSVCSASVRTYVYALWTLWLPTQSNKSLYKHVLCWDETTRVTWWNQALLESRLINQVYNYLRTDIFYVLNRENPPRKKKKKKHLNVAVIRIYEYFWCVRARWTMPDFGRRKVFHYPNSKLRRIAAFGSGGGGGGNDDDGNIIMEKLVARIMRICARTTNRWRGRSEGENEKGGEGKWTV
jgi:hypothetical protein